MINQIYKKVEDGIFKKVNTRDSWDIAVSVGGLTYNCRIVVDDIFDLKGTKLFTIEQHIGIQSAYHTVEIFDHKKQEHFPEIQYGQI